MRDPKDLDCWLTDKDGVLVHGDTAIPGAKELIELPQQAVEATKRLMNVQLEKSVMASLDYANLAEYVSFGTADFNRIVDGLIAKK